MTDAPKRKMRNLLLQPLLQIKLGLFCILLSIAFAMAASGLAYFSLQDFYGLVLELTDVQDALVPELQVQINHLSMRIAAVALLYVIFTLLISIIYTHRLVGPTYAFRRHIQMLLEGKTSVRTQLRNGDAFQEVADDLNRLSEYMDHHVSRNRSEE